MTKKSILFIIGLVVLFILAYALSENVVSKVVNYEYEFIALETSYSKYGELKRYLTYKTNNNEYHTIKITDNDYFMLQEKFQ